MNHIAGIITLGMLMTVGCLEPGTKEKPKYLEGSISEHLGQQSALAQAQILLIDQSNGSHQRAEVNQLGHFKFQNVDPNKKYTLSVLSKDLQTVAVLVAPSKAKNHLAQYFSPKSGERLTLIKKGSIISFQDLNTVSLAEEVIHDRDANGLPDGIQQITHGSPTQGQNLISFRQKENHTLFSIDSDLDGIPNNLDHDIDGDQVLNAFDPSTRAIQKGAEKLSLELDNQVIKVRWFAVSQEVNFTAEDRFQLNIKVGVKLLVETKSGKAISKSEIEKIGVSIAGSSSLFSNTELQANPSGIWTKELIDDGKNEDGNAGDLIFARLITLSPQLKPAPNSIIFFRVDSGVDKEQNSLEWSYPLADLIPKTPINAQYNPVSSTIRINSPPFPNTYTYHWLTEITRKVRNEHQVHYKSQPLAATEFTHKLPEKTIEAEHIYQYRIRIFSIEPVLGYPSISINYPYQKIP